MEFAVHPLVQMWLQKFWAMQTWYLPYWQVLLENSQPIWF